MQRTAGDTAAPQVLDNPTANAAQGAPAASLPTASQPATAQQPATSPGISLAQAVETVQATVELAARQGLTQARIQLHPAELGEIRIHLTQTSAGLLARVSAESSAAAQALISAHAELRQSLSSLGIDLAQLHVGAHESGAADLGQPGAGSQQQAGAQQHHSAQASGERRGDRTSTVAGRGDETLPSNGATAPSDELSAPTALVDVLA
ncbi:MAG TPA: flagellar hook-length control protein FliK [Solirubrobacteraceae bacterium]|nr:flagellar hook-length control protein FliK [Solirubrobacteraceae bacterium]